MYVIKHASIKPKNMWTWHCLLTHLRNCKPHKYNTVSEQYHSYNIFKKILKVHVKKLMKINEVSIINYCNETKVYHLRAFIMVAHVP